MTLRKAWRGLLLAGGAYLAKRWWEKRRVAQGMTSGMGSAAAPGKAGYPADGGLGSDPDIGAPPGI